ncbi:MAG: ABC transporter permease [Clostridiales bacterium]|jgi:putative ABC transport system permease protein|nr:ABC transporter permease [Clostridiales bacterium]
MLNRKMLRDIKGNLAQFISIFVMVFLSVFFFSGISGEWRGLQSAADDFYQAANFADVWVYSESGISQADADAVRDIDGVSAVMRRTMLKTAADLPNNPEIELYYSEENTISTPYVTSGEEFAIDKDGLWLDERFANARGLKLGETLTLNFKGQTLTKTVKGLVLSPEYVYMTSESMTPEFFDKGFAFVSASFIGVGTPFFTQLLIKTDVRDFDALERAVSDALGGKYGAFLTRDNQAGYNQFSEEVAQHRSMADIFPPVFVLVAMLTMVTTMTRIVDNQRTQIGTLKAVGFSGKKITLSYLGYAFYPSVLASVLGVLLGPIVLPPLFYPSMSAFYTLPTWTPAYHYTFYIVAAATVAFACLAAYLATRRTLKLSAAAALRAKNPKTLKSKAAKNERLWQKLGFNLQWNLRDMYRNKTRSVMAVVGALGCTALLVCALSMNADMLDAKIWQYGEINRFESKLILKDDLTSAAILNVLKAANGEGIMEDAIEIRANGGKYSATLTVTDGGSLLTATDKNRKPTVLPKDGVSLSYKIANRLGVKVGDTVEWHIFGKEGWLSCRVAAIYRAPTGQGLRMEKTALEAFGIEYKPTAVLSESHIGADIDGVASVMYTDDLTRGWDNFTEAMLLMVAIMIAAAITLAVTVLYNLGILSFTEMRRELATLKVVGFSSGKINRLLLSQNLILTALGFILGIPTGILLVKAMTLTMGDGFDIIEALHLTDVIFSALIIFGVALAVNLLFRKRITKIDLVSSLKGNE